MTRVVVGIDPGGHTGIAVLDLVTGGLLELHELQRRNQSNRKADPWPLWRCWGAHVKAVRAQLAIILARYPAAHVAIEDPRWTRGKDASHAHGRILGAVEAVCASRLVLGFHLVPVKTAKLTATGHGTAEKDEMIAAAVERWGADNNWTEHTADAAWIAETARLGGA